MDRLEYDTQQAIHAWVTAGKATSPQDARPWLERAYRFASADDQVAFSLATVRLADGDAAAARTLFETIAARHPVREVLTGLAASADAMGDRDAAMDALGRALCWYVPSESMLAIARARAGAVGWCGLFDGGKLLVGAPGRVIIALDNVPVALDEAGRLPAAWRTAAALAVTQAGRHQLGSPIDLAHRRRTEGFVAVTEEGIAGWAWLPAAPEADPTLSIVQGRRTIALTATEPAGRTVRHAAPLARPRGFSLRCDTTRVLRVLGPDGRDLWGSPLGGKAPIEAAPAPRPGTSIAVVIPVYRNLAATRACLTSVLSTIGPGDRVIVVDDASPEADLVAYVTALANQGLLTLLPANPREPGRNLGFPAAANAGLAAADGRDVVLLNSDTIVFADWLGALRTAAHAQADIGTATPFSNDASIFSYPDPNKAAPVPSGPDGARMARLAARANGSATIDVPTAHGFCMFIRAECLHRTGLFRSGLFAQGYGEENDFCERARALGFRHVAVPGVYVAHQGGASFGAARAHLLQRNLAVLQDLHPAYFDLVAAFAAADPLAPARRRLDLARLRAAHRGSAGAVLIVTHATRGGTTRVVQERAALARAAGLRPVLLRGDEGVTLIGDDGELPNLRFALPSGKAELTRLLRALRPVAIELHHMMGHDFALLEVLGLLSLPMDVWVHDYGCLCPRMTFVTGEGQFCGEAPAQACVACVARWDQAYTPPIDAATLRAIHAKVLGAARRVVVASHDVATRVGRHFPAANIDLVPLQPDPPPRRDARKSVRRAGGRVTVAVVGALSDAKGYDVLLACAKDSAARGLNLHFVVVGFTVDDTPLLETGRVFVTGYFQPEEAAGLIAASGAEIAFLPSIWPETWCYALTDAWDGGLDAVVFDIGTPAERVRRTGRGLVLPLGLPPALVNDVLLNRQTLAGISGA
jgi:GT2 family glycosyltransferase/glycosyltransferase involved in cell wall biosynthesis